jgi:hypothetical protein
MGLKALEPVTIDRELCKHGLMKITCAYCMGLKFIRTNPAPAQPTWLSYNSFVCRPALDTTERALLGQKISVWPLKVLTE